MDFSRTIYKTLKLYLTKYPILAVTGPRQSGKTTFLRNQFPDYKYISLENLNNRNFANNDTEGFLKKYNEKVIFDEVQQVPKLFSYIQTLVDDSRMMGQFILSGSQNFNLMENITQSLAGRVAIFKIFPFDMKEMKSANWLSDDISKVMTNGFYPAVFDRQISPDKYYTDYISTYLLRDVSQLLNIQDRSLFVKFIHLCAIRCGQLVNFNDLARDTGVSHTTVRKWLSILETSYIVYFIHPYFKNFGKRLIKSPKMYFYDTGLLTNLLGIRNADVSPTHNHYGHIFENMIINELVKQNEHKMQLRSYYFWRDSKGNEVDLLYHENEKTFLGEIKSTQTIMPKLFEGMDKIEKVFTENIASKTLFYSGDENEERTHYDIISWKECGWN